MYDAETARIKELKSRFEQQTAEQSIDLKATAREYLDALQNLVDSFNHGAGGDPRLMGLDTTGQLDRAEERVAWAEAERRRVRKMLATQF
jgi:hypothetical protein